MFYDIDDDISGYNLLVPLFCVFGNYQRCKLRTTTSSNYIGYFGICLIRGYWTSIYIFDIKYTWKFDFGHHYSHEEIIHNVAQCNLVQSFPYKGTMGRRGT